MSSTFYQVQMRRWLGSHLTLCGRIVIHMLRSQRRFAGLLARLVKSGMISFPSSPGHTEVGLFILRKKDGRQRLVVDARPASFFFNPPPPTSLPSGSAFTRMKAGKDGLYVSGLDC